MARSAISQGGARHPLEPMTVRTDSTVCDFVVGTVVLVAVAVPPATVVGEAAEALLDADPDWLLPAGDAPACDPAEDPAELAAALGAAAVPPAVAVPAVEGLVLPAGTNRPVRFQNAENPLNGPPTT